MQQLVRIFVVGAALSAAGVSFGSAAAADFDRLAVQGLVPPATDATNASVPAIESRRQPGLRLPHDITGRAADTLDFIGGNVDGPAFYSGTRTAPWLGLEHTQAIGGMRYPFSGNWISTIEASVDAGSPFAARGYGLFGQVQRALPGGFDVSLGLQYNVYESGAARLPGGAWDPANPYYHQGLPLHPAAAGTSATTGYELRLNYRYGERNTFGLTYGSGREFDYTRQMLGGYPGDGRQFGLTGQHWLTPDWALSYGLMAQDQVGPQRGQGLRLGLRYRF